MAAVVSHSNDFDQTNHSRYVAVLLWGASQNANLHRYVLNTCTRYGLQLSSIVRYPNCEPRVSRIQCCLCHCFYPHHTIFVYLSLSISRFARNVVTVLSMYRFVCRKQSRPTSVTILDFHHGTLCIIPCFFPHRTSEHIAITLAWYPIICDNSETDISLILCHQ